MRMILTFRMAAVLAAFVFLNGCSSCGSATDNPANTNGNNGNVIIPKEVANSSTKVNANGENKAVPYPGMENGNNPTLDNSKVTIVKPDLSKASTPVTPMPDNSEMFTGMAPDGSFVETRKFLKDSQLSKIERIMKSPKDITVKVYLKSGKVLSVPEGTIKNYRRDPATTILAAVGVKVSERPAKPTSKQEAEQDSN